MLFAGSVTSTLIADDQTDVREPVRQRGARLLSSRECASALRDGGAMWIAFATEDGLAEMPATYTGSGRSLLVRLAPGCRVDAQTVAVAAMGDRADGTWRVVGLARVTQTRRLGDADVLRIEPGHLLGSLRAPGSDRAATGFGTA